MIRARSFTLACLLLSLCAGCNSNSQTPAAPTTTLSNAVTEVFSGTLSPGRSLSYAFSLGVTVPVRISLGSLTDTNFTPISTTLTLSFGVPSGTGCGVMQSVSAASSLATQISVLIAPGTYCVSLADTGQLSAAALFGVRLTYGEASFSAGAGSITYDSSLLPGGSTTRTFDASAAGTVTVSLDTIDQPGVAALGLGIGFPRNDGGGCQISQTFVASRGSQFSLPVDSGTYCVKVSDLGTLPDVTKFSLRIQHP